jgi:hypothetical protein
MTGKVCQQKALVVNSGVNTTLDNLELFGVSDDENVAGVRHQGVNFTMRNMHIHDNDDGVLAGTVGDYILFDGCNFHSNGWNASSGMAHNMYINHARKFTLSNSKSTRTKRGGMHGHQ